MTTQQSAIEILQSLPEPVLIVSSSVGRGIHSLGEGLRRTVFSRQRTIHTTVEDLAGIKIAREDRDNYRHLLQYFPNFFFCNPLLRLNYWRKNLRESSFLHTDLTQLTHRVQQSGAASLVTVSHRPAFWLGWMKHQFQMNLPLVAVAADFTPSSGWFHLPPGTPDIICYEGYNNDWQSVFPASVQQRIMTLKPCHEFPQLPENRPGVMISGGAWGLGHLADILQEVTEHLPETEIHLCCGDNQILANEMRRKFHLCDRIQFHELPADLTDVQIHSRIVITKPGCASLVEARAAGQKIFLLPPLHSVEAGNARYARETMGAEGYSIEAVKKYLRRHGA